MNASREEFRPTVWCSCAESFSGEYQFLSHVSGLSHAKHHRSPAVAADAPVLPGGVIRTLLDTTDGRRVTAEITVTKVKRYSCGCWGATAERPGPDRGPYTGRQVEVMFQQCARPHDDGWDGTGPRPAPPEVVKRAPDYEDALQALYDYGYHRDVARSMLDTAKAEPGIDVLSEGETRVTYTDADGYRIKWGPHW
jgi:hypothetical protein